MTKQKKSYEWIKTFAKELDEQRHAHNYYDESPYDESKAVITAEVLIEAAKEHTVTGGFSYRLSFDFSSYDFPSDFWYHYQIVTGEIVRAEDQNNFFNCSC